MQNQLQHILLFGDQAVEKLPILENLVSHAPASPLLQRFLDRAIHALQVEVAKLPKEERGSFQDFESLLELARRYDENPTNSSEIVATAVMYIARLGELFLHTERDPGVLGSLESPTEILAFCTGGIPAAITTTARDTEELLALSIEGIAITLRLASGLVARSNAIDSATNSWAITLLNSNPQDVQIILDRFHKVEVVPISRRLAISTVGQGWLTISGPPGNLERLFKWSSEIAQLTRIPTSIRSSAHSSHLPVVNHVKILGDSPLLDLFITPKAQMVSPFTRAPYGACILRELLQQVITDIGQNAMFVEQTIAHALDHHVGTAVALSVMGNTQYLSYVERALAKRKMKYEVMSNKPKFAGGNLNSHFGSRAVAVVGMSGRFPGSRSVDELWKHLLQGRDFVTQIPESRFNLKEYYDKTHNLKNSTAACFGTFLDHPGMFDTQLFKMSPREAAQTDSLQRLYLTTTYEALEMAGYKPDATLSTNRNRINTYFGQASDDWRDTVPGSARGVDIYYMPGISRAFAPSRLNYHFKWGGGSYSIDNACASSLTAISLACTSLLAKECDMALAGGGSILQSPHVYAGLSRAGMRSPTGGCKTFQADADGYCRGEGVGVVVLKRLEDAVADRDNIVAVIKGAARSYNNTASSMTHPAAKDQERLYRQVLRQSNISPNEISYIEMHGTGTQVGDLAEMTSVLSTFAQGRTQDNPLVVGAIKASIGHGEAAAGICSFIKALMILQTHQIPPQPGFPFTLNPKFPDLVSRNVYIASKGMMLSRQKSDLPQRVFVNSFDASGGNTCVAIEEAPMKTLPSEDPRLSHVIVVTGKTKSSFLNNRKRLRTYIKQTPKARIADLAYTTTARRMHEAIQAYYTGKSIRDLLQTLDADIALNDLPSGDSLRNIAFLFTGQGSQYVGMGQDLFRTQPEFRDMMLAYECMATSQGLPPFLHLITADELNIASEPPGPVQMALITLEIALAKLWISWGVRPNLVIGHSLGEYAALCVAGVLSVSDTLYLVGKRARLLEERLTASAYTMLVVREEAATVQEHLARANLKSCNISLNNSPSTTVISGLKSDIDKLRKYLSSQSLITTLLTLPYGFHSEQLDLVLEEFESIAHGVVFSEPRVPVASTLLARVCVDAKTFSPSYLRCQMRQAVDYRGTLENARSTGHITGQTLFIEVGPQPVCSSFVTATLGPSSKVLPSLKKGEDGCATISNSISIACTAGCAVDWPEFHRPYSDNLSLLDLPTYAFDETEFWTPFVSPLTTQSSAHAEGEPGSTTIGPKIADFPNSFLQQVTEWRIEGETVSASFITDTSNSEFEAAIYGHVVNGFSLVPVAMFTNMAVSAARYVQIRLHPDEHFPLSQFSVHDFSITKPIVLTQNNSLKQLLTVVSYSRGSSIATVSFETLAEPGPTACGRCSVSSKSKHDIHSELSRSNFLVRSRIDALSQEARTGTAHMLSKTVIYRLFENLVKVGSKYRGLESAILGSSFRDASAEVALTSATCTRSLGPQPYWLDSSVQISGVLLNCGLNHPDEITFISTGLESWYFFEELKPDCKYTSYVQFQELKPDSSIEGDVTVLHEGRLVSHLRGVRSQKLNRSMLTALLSAASTKSAGQSEMVFTPVPSSRRSLMHESPSLAPSETKPKILLSANPIPVVVRTKDISRYVHLDEEATNTRLQALFEIVAAECGCPIGDIVPTIRFKDIGVDSLMAMTIGAAVKTQLNLELPGTFFLDHETMGEALSSLGLHAENVTAPAIATMLDNHLPTFQTPLIPTDSFVDAATFTLDEPTDESKILQGHGQSKVSAHSSPESDPPFDSLWTVVATPNSTSKTSPTLVDYDSKHEETLLDAKIVR